MEVLGGGVSYERGTPVPQDAYPGRCVGPMYHLPSLHDGLLSHVLVIGYGVIVVDSHDGLMVFTRGGAWGLGLGHLRAAARRALLQTQRV